MRFACLLALLVGCSDAPSDIVITSPQDGDTAFIPSSVTLTIEGHHVDKTVEIDVTADHALISGTTDTFPSNCVDCTFTVTFPGTALSPGSHTIGVSLEYDLSQIAYDEVALDFVAP